MRLALPLVAALLLSVACLAQESHRDLEGPGQYTKLLSPGQTDSWAFEGKAGESIMAFVSSNQFDPVLALARKGATPDKTLISCDDEGNESRFAFRLPEKGEYEIRVHAFQHQGSGNYALRVQRFEAQPLVLGTPAVGLFDRQGKGYHYVSSAKDRILVAELKGARPDAWTLLDAKGRNVSAWNGAVLIEEPGEQTLIVTGRANNRYELVVREARVAELVDGKQLTGRMEQGMLDVWNISGKAGDFRVLEIVKQGALTTRVIHAPPDRKQAKKLLQGGEPPEMQFLPIGSSGNRMRDAVVFGRTGRYQLQIHADTAASYELTMRDPTTPISAGAAIRANLPVGGAAFYSFDGVPGQLINASLASDKFVPVLRLFDERGSLVSEAEGDDSTAKFTLLIQQAGHYRMQVASLGDGGGGEFQAGLREQKPKDLEIGGRGQGTLQGSDAEFWSFTGKENMTVIVSARSPLCELVLSLRGPSGVELHNDTGQSAANDKLFAIKLPKSGKYTVRVVSGQGAGAYTLRLIDGD